MCHCVSILFQYSVLVMVFMLAWIFMVKIRYQNVHCEYNSNRSSSSINKNLSSIDSRLKLNHLTTLGTHNSYHKESLFYKYEHSDLEIQLAVGIRQLELDVHLTGDNYVVYHVPLIDDKTNCYCFSDCLARIHRWSQQNPTHSPIFLFIEFKYMFYENFLTPLYGGVQCRHFESMKEQVLQVFSIDSFILPDLIRGDQSSINLALKKQRQDELNGNYTYGNYGWPPLSLSLGKILIGFIDEEYNIVVDLISTCKSLSNFFFITQTNVNLPYASIINIPNPLKNEQLIIESQMNGQLTRALVGYGDDQLFERYKQAWKYGIHIISTDSVQCNDTELCQNVQHDFPNSSPIVCNTVLAPSFCNITISSL